MTSMVVDVFQSILFFSSRDMNMAVRMMASWLVHCNVRRGLLAWAFACDRGAFLPRSGLSRSASRTPRTSTQHVQRATIEPAFVPPYTRVSTCCLIFWMPGAFVQRAA
jgi:hypothetical protein